MQFNIQIDRDWDEENFLHFWENSNPTIKEFCPELKTKEEVHEFLDKEYQSGRVQTEAEWFTHQSSTLNRLAKALSEVISNSWDGIEQIGIYASACPVCPRFFDPYTFFVYYTGTPRDAFRLCAHEMGHFLYFKKLKKLLGKEIDTECPGFEWLLSEILIVPIVNDPKVQEIVGVKELEPYIVGTCVPSETIAQVEQMWNPDKMLEIRECAYELLKDYVRKD